MPCRGNLHQCTYSIRTTNPGHINVLTNLEIAVESLWTDVIGVMMAMSLGRLHGSFDTAVHAAAARRGFDALAGIRALVTGASAARIAANFDSVIAVRAGQRVRAAETSARYHGQPVLGTTSLTALSQHSVTPALSAIDGLPVRLVARHGAATECQLRPVAVSVTFALTV